MTPYKLSLNAKEDLRRIYYYGFHEYGESQADRYFWGIYEAFDKIASNPLKYQTVDHIRRGYRRCVYGSDTIYFKINQSSVVEIMAVLGGQDTDEWL